MLEKKKRPIKSDVIVVYTKEDCPFCDYAKDTLNDLDLWFEERPIKEYKELYGLETATAPRIMVNGELFGGYDTLRESLL